MDNTIFLIAVMDFGQAKNQQPFQVQIVSLMKLVEKCVNTIAVMQLKMHSARDKTVKKKN